MSWCRGLDWSGSHSNHKVSLENGTQSPPPPLSPPPPPPPFRGGGGRVPKAMFTVPFHKDEETYITAFTN